MEETATSGLTGAEDVLHHQECISHVTSTVKFQRWVRIITPHLLLLDKPNTAGQAEHQTCEKWSPL